jgi:fructose-bisphosphate aldolase class I
MADSLRKVVKDLVSPKKGILAADWSLGSSEKHFGKNNIEHTEENRRKYRQLIFTTPGLEEFISGVILFDETIRQKTDDSKPFPQFLEEKGIIPGIKVDKGMKDMAHFPGEKVSEGLDGLRDRLSEYRDMGAKFTKWRSAISIAEGLPTQQCIESNAECLARYAALSQEAGLVPVVEPEVEMKGKHSIARDEVVSRNVLTETFSALERHRVKYDEMILKTNFIHPGKESEEKIDHELIAEETLITFERTLPSELPGVVFLSGGDSSEEATMHLNWVIKKKLEDKQDLPWEISFSFARAIQYPAIEIWGGKDENIEAAQKAVLKRARLNSLARQGLYKEGMEKEG